MNKSVKWLVLALLVVLAAGVGFIIVGKGPSTVAALSSATRGSRRSPMATASPGSVREMQAVPRTEPEAPARQRIAGRVSRDDGPAEDAWVRLARAQPDATVPLSMEVRTSQHGHFDFGLLAAERYLVVAGTADATSDVHVVDLRDATARPPSDQLHIRLTGCRAFLVGRVTDELGTGLPRARVLRSVRGASVSGAITHDQGRYELCVPLHEYCELRVEADGYGTLAVLIPGVAGRIPRDFVLSPEAVVQGLTLRAEDGKPVPHARVRLEPLEPGLRRQAPWTTLSDENGRFVFHRVAGGAIGLAPPRTA